MKFTDKKKKGLLVKFVSEDNNGTKEKLIKVVQIQF